MILRILESQLLIAKSPRTLRLALNRPGVIDAIQDECYSVVYLLMDCDRLKVDDKKLLEHVERNYFVSSAGHSRIIAMGYRSPLPEVAFILTNASVITYLEDQRGENAQLREAASRWLLHGGEALGTGNAATLPQWRKSFYEDLFKKAVDLETERRTLVKPDHLVSLAELPTRPYFPKPIPIAAAGLFISVILSALIVSVLDYTGRLSQLSDRNEIVKVRANLSDFYVRVRKSITGFYAGG